MHLFPARIILVCLSLLISYTAFGQEKELHIDQWIKDLSVKHDVRLAKFSTVYEQVARLDSTNKCLAFSRLQNEGPKNHKRYIIKLALLKDRCYEWDPVCDDKQTIEDILEEGFKLAYEIEDEYLIALMNDALFKESIRKQKLGLGIMYGMIAREMEEEQGLENFEGIAFNRNHLSHSLYHSREYKMAIPVLHDALQGFTDPVTGKVDTLDPYYRMNCWNTLGLCYEKTEKYDSAIIAFNEALAIALHEHELFWTGLVKGNIGSVFFHIAKYDTAEVLLQKDIQQSISSLQYDNAANSMLMLAQIDVIRDRPDLGLEKLKEAKRWLQSYPKGSVWASLYHAYIIVYQKLGNADSLYSYMQLYQPLHDSLETIAYNNRAEIVKMRLDNEVAVHQILSLNKEKYRITLIRNFSIGIVLLLAGLAYADFRRQKLKIQLQRREAQESQRLAEIEAASAHDKLKEFTQGVLDKSILIENLQQQLLHRDTTAEQHQMIVELSHQQLLTDNDWEKFKSLFDRVYPAFFISIREKAKDITLAELRMAALIRLQLTSKESAAMLGVSLDTIHKTRQRLKQRLQLSPEAELDGLIMTV